MSPVDPARFEGQSRLAGVGEGGLQRLGMTRVHVVGAGSLAGPALLFLARAGVPTLYVDDGADVSFLDVGSWLYGEAESGRPRMLAALDVLAATCPDVEVRPAASDTSATAVLVCTSNEAVAAELAERARRNGLPHVVALGDAAGGEVLAMPVGAPCFRCASRPGARVIPNGGAAAATGALAALELLLILTGAAPGRETGRRITLSGGLPRTEATTRRPGCGCVRF